MDYPCYIIIDKTPAMPRVFFAVEEEPEAQLLLQDIEGAEVVEVHEAHGIECPKCGDYLGYYERTTDEVPSLSVVCPSCLLTGQADRYEDEQSTIISDWEPSLFVGHGPVERSELLEQAGFTIYLDTEQLHEARLRDASVSAAIFRYVCIDDAVLHVGDQEQVLEIQRALAGGRLLLDEEGHGHVFSTAQEALDAREDLSPLELPERCQICGAWGDHVGVYETQATFKGPLCSSCDPFLSTFGKRLGPLVVERPAVHVEYEGQQQLGRFENLEGHPDKERARAHVQLDDGPQIFVPLDAIFPA